MTTRIGDLSVDEMKDLISEAVQSSMEDFMEDIKALYNPAYLASIEEAREDFRRGRVTPLEQMPGV